MCIDTMATKGKKQREARTNWWRRRKSVYTEVWKSSSRKPRHGGPHSPVWGIQKQAAAFRSGAMAPRNTTQYLMELVYSELNITAPSIRKEICSPSQHEHTNSYTSVYTDEDTMDFQHRDFESVFYSE